MKHLFTTLVLLCAWLTPLWAAEPPTEPMLRVESGMHTAVINSIAVDRAGRYLVTASEDKTARVWDLTDGRLLNTLRPPVGADADEGKLYAMAMSPDGAMVAVGGWTRLGSATGTTIYLFDRASGELRHRLEGMPNVTLHLAWSGDGRHLAATLWEGGVRVFRTRDWQEEMADRDYGGSSYWADFDAKGRLVTSCWDGSIRLYDASLRLMAKAKAPGGNRPFGVAFSPDGRRVAVGFADSTAINILDSQDLRLLHKPSSTGVDNGSLSRVAWSVDGRWLYAGGRYDSHGMNSIRRWADQGKGKFQDFPVSSNSLTDLHPLADGWLLFAAGDPLWGFLDGKGKVVRQQQAAIADFRNNEKGFLLSWDGGQVGFGFEPWGKRPARFSLGDGRLELSPQASAGLTPPRTKVEGWGITGWEDTATPKLNGQPLALKPDETSRSLAIAPDGQSFLLGTSWFLYRFDQKGQKLWQVSVPGTVWGVNVSGDGRLVVAALGDGTIRWYGMADHQEVLAFFPHKDGKRWVAWTPSGYYQASPGGEDLIGWHVNQGQGQAAAFYAASRFRENYARPDVVARVLATADEQEALRLANAERPRQTLEKKVTEILPPVVSLLQPLDGAAFAVRQVTLRYRVKTGADAPLTGIKVLVDGRPLENRGIKREEDASAGEITVTLPPQDVTVGLIAENRHGSSEPSQARLIWKGSVEHFVIKPRLYILAVGVSNYQDTNLKLQFAAKDARDFAQVLAAHQGGGLYREVVAKVLGDATRDDILQGLEWLQKETTAKDVAMFFLAGHGVNDRNGVYYFLPRDGNPERLISSAVNYVMIKDTVINLPGKTLAFLDTCHSGNVMGSRRGQVDITQVVNDLVAAENGVVVFASATGNQFSLERSEWGNGAFTKALVEGLSGKASYTGDGRITINQLDLYLSERVKELTRGQQTPTTTKPKTISDYPVVVIP